jgi:hypothetical protein
MSKSQNRGIRNMEKEENVTLQNVTNHKAMDIDGYKISSSELKRIITINEMKEEMQKKPMKSNRI